MRGGDDLSLEMMARREDWNGGIRLYLRQREARAGYRFAQPLTMAYIEPGQTIEPMVSIPLETAQQLMDELWQCGLRPSEGTGSAGAMAAVQAHLKDMRKLVFKEDEK